MILNVFNKQNFVTLVMHNSALIAFSLSSYSCSIASLSSHSLCFLGLGFTSVPQLWENLFPYISPFCVLQMLMTKVSFKLV